MNVSEIWSQSPDVLGGQLVFAGTRVPVETLFVHLEHGKSVDAFLADFPSVQRKQIEGLMQFMAMAFRTGNAERWHDPAA
jgi:uncharacterized protein (DUF433 family)